MFLIRKKGIEKFKKSIELFDEKTNVTVRVIHFWRSKDFEQFLEDFRLMRYPGYGWRYIEKNKN